MAIRFVVLDAVGTLIYPEPDAATVYFEAARRHGSQLSRDEIAARFRESFQRSEKRDRSRGTAGLATSEEHERNRWKAIVAEVICDIPDPEACFVELFDHFGTPEAWRCFDDVGAALNELAQAGTPLAVASNFDNRLNHVCDGLPELAWIESRIISSGCGFRKPSRNFFEAVQFVCNAPLSDMLFVGDDIANDVKGALTAGCQAALVRRHGSRVDDPRAFPHAVISSLSEIPELIR